MQCRKSHFWEDRKDKKKKKSTILKQEFFYFFDFQEPYKKFGRIFPEKVAIKQPFLKFLLFRDSAYNVSFC